MKKLFTISVLATTMALVSATSAEAGLELPTPTYTGVVVVAGGDYVVLDTDFNGRRLLVVDPDTVIVEPIHPMARLRVEFRMGESNLPHARMVEPAPEPPLLPVPSERLTAPKLERGGKIVEAHPPGALPQGGRGAVHVTLVALATALAPLASLIFFRS